MINVAVVDDDNNYRKLLVQYLHKYESEFGCRMAITEFRDGSDLTTDIFGKTDLEYDIVLLDVEMKFMDGMETAKHIRQQDSKVVIVFITNAPQYAISGYEVDALDYVLKPINYFAFSQTINRAVGRIASRQHKYISLVGKGYAYKVDLFDLIYIEVEGHDLVFHMSRTDTTYRISASMKKIEKELDSNMFFRCSQGFMVNLEYVDEIGESDAVVAGARVPVSRAQRRQFIDALNNYMSEVKG